MSNSAPAHAVSVWFDGQELHVHIPAVGDSRDHTVRLPVGRLSIERSEGGGILARQTGWAWLLRFLSDRAVAEDKRLGTKADPVQYDIDAILRTMSATVIPATRKTEAGADLSLEDLDL